MSDETKRPFLILVVLALCNCAGLVKPKLLAGDGYESLRPGVIADVLPLTSSNPSLGEYALTLPVFETGNENARSGMHSGGGPFTETRTTWQMEGEAAQDTITLVRRGSTAFRLFVGPCWMPWSATYELHRYDLVRRKGGWQRLNHLAIASKKPDDLLKIIHQVHPKSAPPARGL